MTKHGWQVVRWPLITSLLSTALGVFVNLATDLKDSWVAWVGVVVLMVLTGLVSAGAQQVSARKSKSGTGRSQRAGNVTTSVNVSSERIAGNVHIYQAGRRTFVVEMAVLVVAGVLVVYLLREDRQTTAPAWKPSPTSGANAAPTPSTSPTTPSIARDGPLQVSESWPLARGCDGVTQIAMVSGGPGIRAFTTTTNDERQQMIAAGAGVWTYGQLYLDLTAPPQKSMRILNLRPLINPARLPPPTWIYDPESGCGLPSTDRIFSLDLDKPSLEDEGVQGGSDTADTKPRREPIGPTFTVSTDQPATLGFHVTGCRANYQWNLEVTYSVLGDPAKYTYVAGPFRTMGFADKTKRYTRAADGSFTAAGVANGSSDEKGCT